MKHYKTILSPLGEYLTTAITPDELANKIEAIATCYANIYFEFPHRIHDDFSDQLFELQQLKDVLRQCS